MAVQRFKDKDGKWVVIGGGAGSGLQYIEERLVYLTRVEAYLDSEDYEISDAERAYNIETLNLLTEGKAVMLVIEGCVVPSIGHGEIDGTIVSAIFGMQVDFESILISIDEYGNAVAQLLTQANGILGTEQRVVFPTKIESLVGAVELEITEEERAYNINTFNEEAFSTVIPVLDGILFYYYDIATNKDSGYEAHIYKAITAESVLKLTITNTGDAEIAEELYKSGTYKVWFSHFGGELTVSQKDENALTYAAIMRNEHVDVTLCYSYTIEELGGTPLTYTIPAQVIRFADEAVLYGVFHDFISNDDTPLMVGLFADGSIEIDVIGEDKPWTADVYSFSFSVDNDDSIYFIDTDKENNQKIYRLFNEYPIRGMNLKPPMFVFAGLPCEAGTSVGENVIGFTVNLSPTRDADGNLEFQVLEILLSEDGTFDFNYI